MSTATLPNPAENTTPQPGTTTTPPATTVPPVKTFTQAEVDQLLNRARTEEKNKLYPDLETQKRRSEELERQLTELRTQQTQNTANPQQSTPQQDQELNRRILELTQQLQRSETEWAQKMQQAVDSTLNSARTLFEQQRLADRREAIIQAAEGKLIPELVTGNTLEEIQASAQKAKETYQRIYEAGKTEAAAGTLPRPVTPGASNGASTTPAATASNGDQVTDYHKLSDADWVKQRNEIKTKILTANGIPVTRT